MKLLIVAAAFLAVVSCCKYLEDHMFHAWKRRHEKTYSSPEEEAKCKQTWLKNWKRVMKHNELETLGEKSFRLRMTPHADMSNNKFKKHVIFRGYLQSTLPRSSSTYLGVSNVNSLPATVDWRNMGYVTEVKDQKLCGSCWAFSTTGSLEGQHFKKSGQLVSLSEQQLVDCSGKFDNKGCKGGLMANAYKYIKANGGIDTEQSYPYVAMTKTCQYNNTTIGATCTGFVDITSGNEDALKEAVATVGPISVAIDASQPSFQLYGSGVYDEPACNSTVLNHAVLIVGYGTDNGKDFWLVKNSWGTRWGMKGYIMMSRNKKSQCGIATIPSYPLV